MTVGDRVVVLFPDNDSPFVNSPFKGWATVVSVETDQHSVLLRSVVAVHFDTIPNNNTYRFPPKFVLPLYVIEEVPGG